MGRIGLFLRIPVHWVFVTMWMLVGAHLGFSEEALVLQPDADGVQRTTLTMESYVYSPNELMAEVGKPVELNLQNESFLVPHNFLLDSPDGQRVIEADVSGGDTETVRFTPTAPGIYPFYCDKQLLFFPNHREEGMEGRLVVR